MARGSSGARARSLFWAQSRGLLLRSYHYQRRQTCSNVCNFLLPPLFLVLLTTLNSVLTRDGRALFAFEREPRASFVARPFEASQCFDQIREADSAAVAASCAADPFVNKFTVPYYAPDAADAELGARNASAGLADGVLGQFSLEPFIFPGALPGGEFEESQTPYDGTFLYEYAGGDKESPLYQAFVAADLTNTLDAAYQTATRKLADKAAFLALLFDDWYTGGSFAPYHTAIGFESVSGSLAANDLAADVTVYYNESALDFFENCTRGCQVFSTVQRLDSAVYKAKNPANSAVAFLRRMPDNGLPDSLSFLNLVISIVLALTLHFFLPYFMGFLVYERQARLRELMSSSGMKTSTYFFSTYMALLAQYGVKAILVTIAGIAINVPFFRLNVKISFVILLFIWGNVLVAHAIFFAPFFGSPETAVVVGWLFVILTNFVGGQYVGTLSAVEGGTPESTWFWVMLLPSFSLQRSVYHAGALNSGNRGVTLGSEIYQGVDLGMCSGNGPFCRSFTFLIVEWAVLLILGIYFDQVFPSKTGVRKHPLFFLGKKRTGSKHVDSDPALSSDSDDDGALLEPDVVAERNGVEEAVANGVDSSRGIVIDRLHKVYANARPPVHAVRGMTFRAREGEITGLIASNGGGKSTLTRMLTGSIDPSSGNAYINGNSILTDLPEIHRNMGICFQQDIQWRDLSVEEHLFFYGRLRGLPEKELKGNVERAIESVDLTFAKKRKSMQCSGGMRRRLSVAIALLGDPEVVLLDESTTGLDPSTTEIVWKAIKGSKEGKTIVLTTHSMEEAKVLCDRVHMLSRGQLKVSGNPEELRLRLGRGYRVSAYVPESLVPDFHDLMMGLSTGSRVETQLGGSLNYSIPKSVPVSAIFETMNGARERLQISDWGVTPSSLEDVFVDMVAKNESEVGVTKLAAGEDAA